MAEAKLPIELDIHEEASGIVSIFTMPESEDEESLCIASVLDEDYKAMELAEEMIRRYNHHNELVKALQAWQKYDHQTFTDIRDKIADRKLAHDLTEAVLAEIKKDNQ